MAHRKEQATASPVGSGITMSNEQFGQFMNMILESTMQLSSDLVEQFNRTIRPSTPLPGVTSHVSGSFAKCTARFNGSDTADVDAFLDNVLTYKDICNVSDENALRGISMLLEGQASTWWVGVKKTIHTWEAVISAFRDAFSRKLPPHLIFREIFSKDQSATDSTETFVCRVRALISQLPYELPAEAQIDIVFGLLNRRIRKKLLRNELTSFKDLLTRARDVERSLIDIRTESRTGLESNDSVKNSDSNGKSKPRCVYCKNYGHIRDDCQKLKKKEKPPEVSRGDSTRTQLACYGCGTIGVVKSKCPICQNKNTVTATASQSNSLSSLSFYHTSVDACKRKRPLLPITIHGFNGAGFADSGAQASVAGAKLYSILQDLGYKFESSMGTLSYADGKQR